MPEEPQSNELKSSYRKPSYLENIGIKAFERFGELDSSLGDQSHVLTADEKHQLHQTQRSAVFKCAVAGILSALLSGLADVWAADLFGAHINYWFLFGGVTLIVSIIEIIYLYHASLKAVHSIANACDASLIKQYQDDDKELVISLVRAALEIKSPKDSDPYVDPLKHTSKWKLIGFSALYKAKVMASNMLAKIVLRKVILRGATRAWLSFIAVPITGAWNAIVCYWITKEALIRSLGPAYIEETIPDLLQDLSTHECAQRALACCIAASNDIHPNHYYMLLTMRNLSGSIVKDEPESIELLLEKTSTLTAGQQAKIMEILSISIMIDGKIKKAEMNLYMQFKQEFTHTGIAPKQHLATAYHT